MVVSEKLLLFDEERERDGVEVREAISSDFGRYCLLNDSLVGLRFHPKGAVVQA